MPTSEIWLEDNILMTTWTGPLTTDELWECFCSLAGQIDQADAITHVLFDIQQSGSIPSQAPMLAIRSKFLSKKNSGRVAVVGGEAIPQILAKVASSVTKRDILFFPQQSTALTYLNGVKAEREAPSERA